MTCLKDTHGPLNCVLHNNVSIPAEDTDTFGPNPKRVILIHTMNILEGCMKGGLPTYQI